MTHRETPLAEEVAVSLGQDSNYTSERSIIALRRKRPRKPKSRGTRSCAGDSCAGPAVPAPGARDRDAPRSTAGLGRNEAAVCATLRALSEGHGGGGGRHRGRCGRVWDFSAVPRAGDPRAPQRGLRWRERPRHTPSARAAASPAQTVRWTRANAGEGPGEAEPAGAALAWRTGGRGAGPGWPFRLTL